MLSCRNLLTIGDVCLIKEYFTISVTSYLGNLWIVFLCKGPFGNVYVCVHRDFLLNKSSILCSVYVFGELVFSVLKNGFLAIKWMIEYMKKS